MNQPTALHQALPILLKKGKTRFFLDTCFALKGAYFDLLDDSFFASLKEADNPLIIPYPVYREIKKKEADKSDADLSKNAGMALKRLQQLKKQEMIRLLGSPDEHFADQVFLEVFTKFRQKYDLVLFTQDRGLTRDLLRLNLTESTTRCPNTIFIASSSRNQVILTSKYVENMGPNLRPRPERRPSDNPPIQQTFRVHTKPRVLNNNLTGVRETLTTGARLKLDNGESLVLGKAIAKGGEGEIFEASNGMVAKIYFPDRRTQWRSDKLLLMCQHDLNGSGVAWPKHRVLGNDSSFVGYLMPKVSGTPMQHCVFGKAALAESFPNWSRRDLVVLARTVATTVAGLHRHGILVGDINPMNILVQSSSKVQLVDADSFQLQDFPCPVGMATFRAPEITEPSFDTFLRTPEHESFALGTLLFMILMGGKPPFSFQGGGDPAENIRNGNFPYAHDHSAIPAGAYRYIWSYLPGLVQRAFVTTFTGKNPKDRPSAAAWDDILSKYEQKLISPIYPDAILMWPASFRPHKSGDSVQLTCSACQTAFQTSSRDAENRLKFPKIYCGTCLSALLLAKKAGENHKCLRCGVLFQVSFHDIQKSHKVVEICETCLQLETSKRRNCKECGAGFFIETGELKFLLSKSLSMPKRCPTCRGKTVMQPGSRPSDGYYKGQNPPKTFTPPPQTVIPPIHTYVPPQRSQPAAAESSIWKMLKDLFS